MKVEISKDSLHETKEIKTVCQQLANEIFCYYGKPMYVCLYLW